MWKSLLYTCFILFAILDITYTAGTFKKRYLSTTGNMAIKKKQTVRDARSKSNKKSESGKKSGSASKMNKKNDDNSKLLRTNKPTTNIASTLKKTTKQSSEETTDLNNSSTSSSTTEVTTQKADERKENIKNDKAIIDMLSKREDRHLSFFKGILPSLKNFDESKTRKFQIALIQIIDNLDNNRTAFQSEPCNQANNFIDFPGYKPYPFHGNNTQYSHNASSISLSDLTDELYF